MQTVFFDIETQAMPLAALAQFYKPLDPMTPFDPSSVKTGDIDKKTKTPIEERELLKQAKIEAAKTAYENEYTAKKHEYQNAFFEKAALSPVTGSVLAIGYYKADRDAYAIDSIEDSGGGEDAMIDSFWAYAHDIIESGGRMIGLGINNFDLPFLVRRSWILGIAVPKIIRDGRYWSRSFIDLSEEWLCGQRLGSEPANLDYISKALGIGGKPDGVTGKDFARLWKEDREAALSYLRNDLKLPAKIAARMGLIEDYGTKKTEPELITQ